MCTKMRTFGSFLCFLVFSSQLYTIVKSEDTSNDLTPSISTTAVSHNIYDCINTSTNKTLLYSATINENAVFLWYVTYTVTYPTSTTNSNLITCVIVTDTAGDGTGGYPTTTSGGVGSYAVEITLTSQWNRGLNFIVKIYADAA